MDSIDLHRIERRARLRYEWARTWRALLGLAPIWIIIGLACAFTHRPSLAISFGLAAFVMGAVMLWYGRDVKRGVLPGLAAGMVPLLFALCANHVNHVCTGSSCMTLCMPACVVGGIVAGLAVAAIGHRRQAGAGFWLGASAMAVLVGAMGCSCIGYAGVVGVAIGYAAGIVPSLLRKMFSA
ncbi:hypothetical protein LZC95_41305 [Pendulispora brunnea]|uniref:Uncharacterized protein n=1 Tax=Pendulispora brunnea TaxID=2905690 RepID=A0ABZ2K7Q7_9BACT